MDNTTSKAKSKPKKKEKECFTCGSIGHVLKDCPKHQEESGNNNNNTQNKFKKKQDVDTFKDHLSSFRCKSAKFVHLKQELYEPILNEILSYLKSQYSRSKGKFAINPKLIQLQFKSQVKCKNHSMFGFAETSSDTGIISFGIEALEEELSADSESGYELEVPYEKKWCHTKEDYLIWLLLHEFVHLFEGFNNDRHDKAFFEQVEELATAHSFLFSKEPSK